MVDLSDRHPVWEILKSFSKFLPQISKGQNNQDLVILANVPPPRGATCAVLRCYERVRGATCAMLRCYERSGARPGRYMCHAAMSWAPASLRN